MKQYHVCDLFVLFACFVQVYALILPFIFVRFLFVSFVFIGSGRFLFFPSYSFLHLSNRLTVLSLRVVKISIITHNQPFIYLFSYLCVLVHYYLKKQQQKNMRVVLSTKKTWSRRWETNLAAACSSGEITFHGYCSKVSETTSVGERPFAMMAARVLDVLWTRSSFSLVFFLTAASADKTGMSAVFLVSYCNILSTNGKQNVAVFSVIVGWNFRWAISAYSTTG